MVVQLEYLEWLDDQGISKDFLETNPKKIAHDTIRKLVKKRKWYALDKIIETLQERGISSFIIIIFTLVSQLKRKNYG